MERTNLENHFVTIKIKGQKVKLRGFARDDYMVAGKRFIRLIQVAEGAREGGQDGIAEGRAIINPDSIETIYKSDSRNEYTDELWLEYCKQQDQLKEAAEARAA